jgi:ribosomal protein S18 acetylase RimI-like enzyme
MVHAQAVWGRDTGEIKISWQPSWGLSYGESEGRIEAADRLRRPLPPAMIATLSLRPALPEDELFLFRLYASTREVEIGAIGWGEADKEAFLWLQFKAHLHHYATMTPEADQRVILLDGRPVGNLIVIRGRREIRLAEITLLSEDRNKGVGSRLIRDLVEEAVEVGLPLRLHVAKFNRAIRLYRRLGFAQIGDTGTHFFMERPPR